MVSAVDLLLPVYLLKWQHDTLEFCSYTDSPLSLSQWLSSVFQRHDEFCYLAILRSSGIWKLLETTIIHLGSCCCLPSLPYI